MSSTYSEDVFAVLEDEWSKYAGNRPADTGAWQRAISVMLPKYLSIRRAGRWQRGPSDFFGVLGISRSELAHCSMIAWLLDPEGRHGLGRTFLDLLIERFLPNLDHRAMKVRSVNTEVQRFETRADIVVWGDTATLVFEAKVDAAEGWNQCDRLFDRFSEEPGARFIFLTPSGRAPVTATGPAGDAFVPLSFDEIADCLEAAIESASKADVDRGGMAHNYLLTLRSQFS